jgi:hydroxypyruvate isomerase
MTRLAANLSMMFTDLPFLDRFDAAAAAGFKGVEYLFPYEVPAERIRERLDRLGLKQVLFNAPAGNWAAGDRGMAADPSRVDACREGVRLALDYARALECGMIHLMAGKIAPGADRAPWRETLVENVRYAADLAAKDGVRVLLEPINTKVDIPGYFHDTTEEAVSLIDAAGRPNVMLQYDIYHMQIMEGDLARTIERLLPRIAHVQLADNPGRGEPGTGEINYPWLLGRLDALGYAGWVGCEYKPVGDTTAGLGWARPFVT